MWWHTITQGRGNWQKEWVASTLHTTAEYSVSSITTADVHTSDASSRLNWCHCRFKWTRPFHRKTKSGFCACAITFQLVSTYLPMKMEQCSETSAYKIQTPGNYPEESQQHQNTAKVWNQELFTPIITQIQSCSSLQCQNRSQGAINVDALTCTVRTVLV